MYTVDQFQKLHTVDQLKKITYNLFCISLTLMTNQGWLPVAVFVTYLSQKYFVASSNFIFHFTLMTRRRQKWKC